MDAYLKFEGEKPKIEGDSLDEQHKGWIEVSNWGWHLSMPLTTAKSSGGARTAGQVKADSFTFDKVMDRTTPQLYTAMCKGTHFEKVTLEIMRSVGEGEQHKAVFCRFDMNYVIINKFTPNGGSDAEPTESLELLPGMVKLTYTPFDAKSGKATGKNKPFGWDFISNREKA